MADALPTDDDRVTLRARLTAGGAMSADDVAVVEPAVRVRALARGATFLAPGDIATWCGVLASGLMREYYPVADGREVTRGFAGPGDLVGSLSDLLRATPSRSAVVAETDARVILLPWAQVQDAAARRSAWAAALARITEALYLTKAEREYELIALDAEARYARFRARYAALEAQIAQRHVASYIGVTPEHLSRLRRRLASAAPRATARTRRGS